MKAKKYNVLILSKLNSDLDSLFKSAASLSKVLNTEMEFFYVKKPTDVVQAESQLSAMRSYNSDYISIDHKMKEKIRAMENKYGLQVTYSFAIGNTKNEIADVIAQKNPDIIILGKRKSNAFNPFGDSVTDMVLNTFKGTLFFADHDNTLSPEGDLTLGVLKDLDASYENEFIHSFLSRSKQPLNSFAFANRGQTAHKEPNNTGVREYVFESNDNSLNNLSTYIVKNGINLLLLNRKDRAVKGNDLPQNIKVLASRLKVSLFISNKA